ncbi:MAG: DUF2264 domain-containing protein, partial [Bacteroidaceae bacterium]|nr:DUF2264 domain-containing protein [Bacteroidaceae bacterium]
MKKTFRGIFIAILSLGYSVAFAQVATPTHKIDKTFTIPTPNYKISPYTGLDRQGWIDAAEYLLEGAFTYVRNIDDPMYFPKQFEKTYPRDKGGVITAKLEGFCRTLFLAAPLLKENPDLTLNGIKVADYYRHQLLNLLDPKSPSYVKPLGKNGGPSQTLVEFGALAISLSTAKNVLWDPLTQEQKDKLAATMLSYGNGPTIGSNWMFFNVFVISFFKQEGYKVNDWRMEDCLKKLLALYRGEGWYNDAPAYDYYSMWAFQMYGPIWAQMYGHFYPEYAAQFMKNQADLIDNYPYMFNAEGKMNMWGRSIPYRFGAVVPLALLGYQTDKDINFGWMRRIASSTLLQFIQNPNLLEDNVPTLGFYGPFEPAVQIYSCRGSVYWCAKAFLSLLLPADNPFWAAKENNGPWDKEFKKDHVYNKFQPATNLLITDYPNVGGSEMRSWCHETVAKDWQKFRSSENYNKLAYHTEFPWMADGKNGEVSMNYATKNAKGEWEVLRLYTFKSFEDGIYRRDAVLETNLSIKYNLADIPLPNGVLRIDRVSVPSPTDIRLGHYTLSETFGKPVIESKSNKVPEATIISNGEYSLAMVNLTNWDKTEVLHPEGIHPVTYKCGLIQNEKHIQNEEVMVTLMLWKKGDKQFSKKELTPVKSVKIADDKSNVIVTFADKSVKT